LKKSLFRPTNWRYGEWKVCWVRATCVQFEGDFLVMNKTLGAVIAAATLTLASQAPAAVINFSSLGTGVSGATGVSGITYTATATYGTMPGYLGSTAGTASVFSSGMGVVGAGEADVAGPGRRIDGLTANTWEMITVTFSGAVDLSSFVLGLMDSDDDFEYCFNACGSFTSVGTLATVVLGGQESRTYTGLSNVTSFSVRATGVAGDINDDFILESAEVFAVESQEVSPVPLPAGAPLLLAGLAGLAALRRRKNAA
jgi:hypothetical protein